MIEKYVVGELMTNTYVISNGDKCVIVDPGLGFNNVLLDIKSKYTVEAILITHGHVDHIDGLKYFLDVPVYIHKQEEAFLYDMSLSLYSFLGLKCPFKKGDLKVKLVNDNDVLNLIGLEFKVIHTPGHTIGSVCYQYGNKLLSGDTLFKGSAGRTDFPTGSMLSLKKSLNRIVSECPLNMDVYPGHEGKTNIRNEKNYNPFI